MQLLIYETAVPVSSVRHATASVDVRGNYDFSRHVNSVPLMSVEFPFAAGEYPIVFAGSREAVMPAAVLGLRDRENLFLDAAGSWLAAYVPAFVRRYPFVFSRSSGEADAAFTLCIDEAFAGFNTEGRGQRLFNDDGTVSPFTSQILGFVQEYQRQFERTRAFCEKLRTLDLLELMQAQVGLAGGERSLLSGFMVVDRNKLKALPAAVLAELTKSDELELLYLHLYSLRNFAPLTDRMAAAAGGAGAATPQSDPA